MRTKYEEMIEKITDILDKTGTEFEKIIPNTIVEPIPESFFSSSSEGIDKIQVVLETTADIRYNFLAITGIAIIVEEYNKNKTKNDARECIKLLQFMLSEGE